MRLRERHSGGTAIDAGYLIMMDNREMMAISGGLRQVDILPALAKKARAEDKPGS